MGKVSRKIRKARLRWFGHVLRREESNVGNRVRGMVVSKKRRGKPEKIEGLRLGGGMSKGR